MGRYDKTRKHAGFKETVGKYLGDWNETVDVDVKLTGDPYDEFATGLLSVSVRNEGGKNTASSEVMTLRGLDVDTVLNALSAELDEIRAYYSLNGPLIPYDELRVIAEELVDKLY